MNLKNLLVAGMATALSVSVVANITMVKYVADHQADVSTESETESSVVNTKACKAVYSNLESILEVSTSNLNVSQAAYDMVKNSSTGTPKAAEVTVAEEKENYSDITAVSDKETSEAGIENTTTAADNNHRAGNGTGSTKGNAASDNSHAKSSTENSAANVDETDNSADTAIASSQLASNNVAGSSNAAATDQPAGNKTANSSSAAASSQPASNKTANSSSAATSSQSAGNKTASTSNASQTPSQPAGNNTNTAGNSSGGSSPAPTGGTEYGDTYRHNTSIYSDDSDGRSLIRVEYYDDDNKLYQYSEVTDYKGDTNSYTETIYDKDNVLVRTDTYVNGELTSSTTP